jgi:hypothetical protein
MENEHDRLEELVVKIFELIDDYYHGPTAAKIEALIREYVEERCDKLDSL